MTTHRDGAPKRKIKNGDLWGAFVHLTFEGPMMEIMFTFISACARDGESKFNVLVKKTKEMQRNENEDLPLFSLSFCWEKYSGN